MSGKRLCVALLSVVVVLVASGMAQDEKNELGGILGRTFISNQGIKNATVPSVIAFGKGLTFDVDYARRFLVTPLYAVAGEVVFAYNPDEGIKNATVPSVIAFGKGLTFDVDYARRFLVTPLYAVAGEVVFAYNPDEDI